MEEKKKRSFWESFKIWFGLGALMFGTYCGANMASGVYATNLYGYLRRRLDVGLPGDLYCLYGFLLRCVAEFYQSL
uniref:Uncharacterized protein n=1 Tax=Faecalibacterium prausnitzii TaxID=853 RepID=A0A564UR21_9FIRM|nr:Uncharacterised protein [Faecalibacterium prausnitzii]